MLRLLPLLRAASPLPSAINPRAYRLLSTSTSASGFPEQPFSLEDYLVASCGLAPAQALEVSKKAFRELLSSGPRLEELSSYPRLNSATASACPLPRSLASSWSPHALFAHAFSAKATATSLPGSSSLSPSTARLSRSCWPQAGTRASSRRALERLIQPNIALLRQWGVPDIAQLCSNKPWVLTFNPKRVEEFLVRAQGIGVPPTSRMFKHAVAVVFGMSKERHAAKLEFFKTTLGFSESQVSTAVSRMPAVLGLSDDSLMRKIEFLVNEAAMEPQYIVERPVLLAFSLEKRLVPRHYVMKILRQNGLLIRNTSLFTLCKLGEEAFKSKFVDCHEDSVPGLADAYAAACAGIVPSSV